MLLWAVSTSWPLLTGASMPCSPSLVPSGACFEKGHSFLPNIVNPILVQTSQGFARSTGLILASACLLAPEICGHKRKVTFSVLIFTKIFAWPKRQPAQGQGGKFTGTAVPAALPTQAPPHWAWQPPGLCSQAAWLILVTCSTSPPVSEPLLYFSWIGRLKHTHTYRHTH